MRSVIARAPDAIHKDPLVLTLGRPCWFGLSQVTHLQKDEIKMGIKSQLT